MSNVARESLRITSGIKGLKSSQHLFSLSTKTLQIFLSSIRCCCLLPPKMTPSSHQQIPPVPDPSEKRAKSLLQSKSTPRDAPSPSIPKFIHSFSLVCDGPLLLLGGSSCAACWLVGWLLFDDMGWGMGTNPFSSSLFSIYSSY
jgi:hypothetical protein